MKDIHYNLYIQLTYYSVSVKHNSSSSSVAYSYIITQCYGWQKFCQLHNYLSKHTQVSSITLTAANQTYNIEWYKKIQM